HSTEKVWKIFDTYIYGIPRFLRGCFPGVKIPPPGCEPNFSVTFFRGPAFSPPENRRREYFVENSPTGGVGIPGNNS
uniref:hypothetical protein n=1 Tax=Alistipes shahii TaxID=328814 RepID=UPI003FEFB563